MVGDGYASEGVEGQPLHGSEGNGYISEGVEGQSLCKSYTVEEVTGQPKDDYAADSGSGGNGCASEGVTMWLLHDSGQQLCCQGAGRTG